MRYTRLSENPFIMTPLMAVSSGVFAWVAYGFFIAGITAENVLVMLWYLTIGLIPSAFALAMLFATGAVFHGVIVTIKRRRDDKGWGRNN